MLLNLWTKIKASPYFRIVVVAILAFLLGLYSGHKSAPATTVTKYVEDTVSKQKLVESIEHEQQLERKLVVAEKTIGEMKVKTVEKIHIVYKKDGTKEVDKTKTTDVDQKTDSTKVITNVETNNTKTVDNKQIVTETKTHVDEKITASPKDKFLIGVSGTIGLNGLSRPGLDFHYRLLDLGKISVWTGASVFTGAPTNLVLGTELRATVGISF